MHMFSHTRRGFTQDSPCQNKRHSRVSLSGIPTLVPQNGEDPRLQISGMTLYRITARGFSLRRHPELDSGSSTLAVVVHKQRAWKMPNQVWHDNFTE